MQSNGEKIVLAVATLLVASLLGCDSKERKNSNSTSLPSNIKTLFEDRCVKCHSGATAPAGFNFVTSQSQMISAGLISPGDPENSVLFQKLSATPPSGDRMPKGGPYLSSDELASISDWITNASLTYSVEITTPSANSYIDSSNNSASFVVSGSCNIKDATITIKANGTSFASPIICDGSTFSTTVDTTQQPVITGANSFVANMAKSSIALSLDSSAVTVTKDLTSLSIALTSHRNSSTADRLKTDTDSSLITTDSTAMTVSGTCNSQGRSVTITVDGTAVASATCDGTNFSTTADTTSWANAQLSPAVSGAHKMVATIVNTGGLTSPTSTVYIFKSTSPTILFSTQIAPLITTPIAGNKRACIDCHYKKITGNPSGSLSYGYWSDCPSGGKPIGASSACADTSATSVSGYATCDDPLGTGGACTTARSSFVFQIGYYKYSSTTAASNEGGYANRALPIVNDRSDSPTWIANRIVRGNPNQSFIYKRVSEGGTTGVMTCYNALSAVLPTLNNIGCKTSQSNTVQMPQYNATYIPNYFSGAQSSLIRDWILEGARTDN